MAGAFPWLFTIRGRLVVLVCIATFPALLFTLYAASNERAAALKRMEDDAFHVVRMASREHTHQFAGAQQLLTRLGGMLAADGDVLLFAREPQFLPALLAGYPQFANIGALSPKGDVLYSALPANNLASWNENPAFVRALSTRDVATGDYVVGQIVGRPVLQLAYAVRRGDDVRMVLWVALDLRWMGQLAAQGGLLPEWSLLIADRGGRVLAQSGTASGPDVSAGAEIPGLGALAEGAEAKVLGVGPNNARRLFVAAPMEGISGVSVVAGLPYDRVYDEANAVFLRTLVSLALLTLFTVVSSLLAAEVSVLRSLRGLAQVARRFGKGDLGARAIVSRAQGEIRELALAFNDMADALAGRQREMIQAREQLRALSRKIQLTREEEAGRIARELHDELGQVLTSLKLDLAAMRRGCAQDGNAACVLALDQGVSTMGRQLDNAIDTVRRVASELRPSVLDRLGLVAALEWQAREIESRGDLAVELNVSGVEEQLDWLTAVTIFRIAQEALTNVVRHAQATTIWVDLRGDPQTLELCVRDDGKGMERSVPSESLGLLGMRERAALVGGTFDIDSVAGHGTTLRVRIPRRAPTENNHAPAIG
ncbi:MAG: HAMP domain-containing protein [Planctomycetes bacterium]|nr:HAMP domain-containing protein [Planctomycetota bacterium]